MSEAGAREGIPDASSPRDIVRRGYDRIAETHADWASRTRTAERARYAAIVLDGTASAGRVLELGCGTGEPTTALLAQHFAVTGIDLSARHVEIARQRVPEARFMHADMTTLDLPAGEFDAVTAFYSIIHVPRRDHPDLLRSIARWLRPGGLFVGTLGAVGDPDDSGSVEADWLGTPMYWSSYDAATNRRLVEAAGLEIVSAVEETADEDGEAVTFLWVVARKPPSPERG